MPFEWGGKRAERWVSARERRHALGDSGAYLVRDTFLFRGGLPPQKQVGSLDPSEFEVLMKSSRELLLASYEKGMRNSFIPAWLRLEITSFGFVYRRRNRPCHLCQTPIAMVRQGEMQRSTYFCPQC
jgi:formamidopyrimidine-DNA glycosylase